MRLFKISIPFAAARASRLRRRGHVHRFRNPDHQRWIRLRHLDKTQGGALQRARNLDRYLLRLRMGGGERAPPQADRIGPLWRRALRSVNLAGNRNIREEDVHRDGHQSE